MADKLETRMVTINELRVDPGAEWPIDGHVARFEDLSENLGGFREKIRRGAFRKTLMEADIRGLFNHDPNYVLGRNKASTMQLEEDSIGLRMRIKPPEAQWASDLIASMKRGDVDQGSFQFRTIRDEWDQSDRENVIRTLVEVQLFDVSIVTFPAYKNTKVFARADALISRLHNGVRYEEDPGEIRQLIEELESFLEQPSAPPEAGHPDEANARSDAGGPARKARLAAMMRNLEILEKEI